MSRLPASKRREQLLDCAAELFAKHGYARATTAQLAKAAGVTEPIIYRHFDSKRDLFVALIERTGRDVLAEWQQHLADASDPADRLRGLIGDNPMVTEKGRPVYRVILQAISEVDDPLIHHALKQHIKTLHEFIVGEVERAQDAHKVTTKFSAEIIGWLLVHQGMGVGVLDAMGVTGHGTDESGTLTRDVVARMLVGRDARPPDQRD